MKWQVHVGDILDVSADILVCSANVYLTLSGGVGGAFLQRYGASMQDALFRYLVERDLRHVERGTVVEMPPSGSPYGAVLHAVAVDGTYETTPTVVADLVEACLRRASGLSAQKVAVSALATGYGRQSIGFFGKAVLRVRAMEFPPVETVVIGVGSQSDAEELRSILPDLGIA